MMQTMKIILVLSMVVCAVSLRSQDKVNFTGNWIFNAEKSDMGNQGGQRGGRGGGDMVVNQSEAELTVEMTRTGRDGETRTMSTTYTLDGEECESSSGSRSTISIVEWAEDGKSLKIISEMTMSRNGEEFVIESEAVWSFEAEMLKIITTRSTSRGEMTSTAYYSKK